jgi:26S proteasome regulatory subunit N5
MIKLDQHDSSYLNIFKHFKHIYDTPCIKNNVVNMKEVSLGGSDRSKTKFFFVIFKALKNVVIYLLLSPFNNEQHDALLRLYEDKNLREMPEYL